MDRIKLENIDKSEWKLYPFEKIAKRISESIDPKKTDLQVYIGLEHLDSESVHIRRHGVPSDVSGGKLKCYPGDVIFGKRRAYQRKAAVVNEEGICSAHAFVFRANDDIIDARLFPWFLHSDQFMHRMVDISVGGLSPTINWSDLKHQEFLLPPKEQQVELADLLWAMDEVIEKDLEVLVKMDLFKKSNLERLLFNPNNPEVKLRDYISEKKQVSTPPHRIKKYVGLEHLISGRNNIDSYGLSCNVLSNCFKVEKGDLLYSKLRPYLDKAVIADSECVATTELIILETESLSKRTVLEILHSARFLDYIKDKGYGTKMPRVNFNIIGEFGFNLPRNIDVLEKKVIELDQTIGLLRDKLQASKTLQKALINQIF